MKDIYIFGGAYQLVFCRVAPMCATYGDLDNPVWAFYPDGSFSRMCNGGHYRSPVGKMRKPMCEYTIADLREILDGNRRP